MTLSITCPLWASQQRVPHRSATTHLALTFDVMVVTLGRFPVRFCQGTHHPVSTNPRTYPRLHHSAHRPKASRQHRVNFLG